MIVIDRPVGPHQDHERMLWDLLHPNPEDVLRQLDDLVRIGSNPLVTAVDAKQAAFIATQAITVLRQLLKQDRVAGDAVTETGSQPTHSGSP